MVYHHIGLTKDASILCTITITWGKDLYNNLPMRVGKLLDIFHRKLRVFPNISFS